MSHILTKSKYIRGLQCERALFLDVYSPKEAHYTPEQLQKFDRGRKFEYHFKSRFPKGIDISQLLGRKIDDYLSLTLSLLNSENETDIFEAGFCFDDVLVLADVVHKNIDGTLDIYEVKSGTMLSDTYKKDASIQHYVISSLHSINSFSLVYSDGNAGFIKEDITKELESQHDEIALRIARMKSVLMGSEPNIRPGEHCSTPYKCPYRRHCDRGIIQLGLF